MKIMNFEKETDMVKNPVHKNIDVAKTRDLALRGMRAIELARELEAYGFWENVHPNQIVQWPFPLQIIDFDITDLNQIKTVADLRQAVKIVRKHFPCFKIKRVIVKEGTNKFQAYICSLKKVWTIAQTLNEMKKAGAFSSIS